jgi:hypothetical protein
VDLALDVDRGAITAPVTLPMPPSSWRVLIRVSRSAVGAYRHSNASLAPTGRIQTALLLDICNRYHLTRETG